MLTSGHLVQLFETEVSGDEAGVGFDQDVHGSGPGQDFLILFVSFIEFFALDSGGSHHGGPRTDGGRMEAASTVVAWSAGQRHCVSQDLLGSSQSGRVCRDVASGPAPTTVQSFALLAGYMTKIEVSIIY